VRAVLVAFVLLAAPVAAQDGKPLDAAERAACEAAGGHVGQGIGPDELCIRPTADAGKACTTNADCESFCMAETATCGAWTPLFGCHEVLVGEGQRVSICLD
jgi:hypothetical protein